MSRQFFRLLIASIFLTSAAAPVLAQIGVGPNASNGNQLHGQVRYAQGGGPSFNILVRLERFDGGVVDQQYTDRNGRFRFAGLRPLTYIVTIHTAGYEDVQQQVELVDKNSDYIILTLRADASSASASPSGPAVILDAKVPLDARRE